MERPQRKHPRLKDYDYSQPGYYYVTIHTQEQGNILSTVGRGLAPAVRLTELGCVAKEQLCLLEQRYPYVRIDKNVIMPTHIHVIIRLLEYGTPEEKRPGIPEIVGAYKSLTTRACNQLFSTPGRKLFQTSFYENVIRNERVYQECWRYIDENPLKWALAPEDR